MPRTSSSTAASSRSPAPSEPVAVDNPEVDFSHQSLIERLTIERHQWLSADELERRPERLADPEMPRLMRVAVAARDRGRHG